MHTVVKKILSLINLKRLLAQASTITFKANVSQTLCRLFSVMSMNQIKSNLMRSGEVHLGSYVSYVDIRVM